MCDQNSEILSKIDTLIIAIEKLTEAMKPPEYLAGAVATPIAPPLIDYSALISNGLSARKRVLATLTVAEMLDRAHQLGLHIDVYGARASQRG